MKMNVAQLNYLLGHRIERVALHLAVDSGRRAWCLFADAAGALRFRDVDPLLRHDRQEWGYVLMADDQLAGFLRHQAGDLVACRPVPGSVCVECIEAATLLQMLRRRQPEAELESHARTDLPESSRCASL